MRRLLRFPIVLTVSALASLGAAATAQAGLLVKSTQCAPDQLTQPFVQWGDSAQYELVGDGDFESSTDWSPSGNASSTSNEPYYVHSATDKRALVLPAGGSVTSPTMCVGIEKPTVRFFVKSQGLLPVLKLDAIIRTSLNLTLTVPMGVITPSSKWQPTLPLPLIASLLPLLPGNHTPVNFKLTSVAGTWSIDDFYVDPYARN